MFGEIEMKIINSEGNEIPFTGKIRGENESLSYYKEGKLHREDGPAIEHLNGKKEWWVNGALHREDGPAVEYPNGDKIYYLKGKEIHYSNLLSLIRNENLMFIGVENGYAKFLNEKNIQETPVKFFIDNVKESIKNYTEWTKTLSQILVSFEKDMNKNDRS